MFTVPVKPWSLSAHPYDRDSLARFWLSAPQDELSTLWSAGFGSITEKLVRELKTDSVFTDEQVSLRNSIGQHLQTDFSSPLTPQLLITVFLYSPPGLFKIGNAKEQLPSWLADVYISLYENPSAVVEAPPANTAPTELPRPDFGPFPPSLIELSQNRIHLNRMLGLSNLYYIDPEDSEICNELIELRFLLAELLQQCPEHELERLWTSDLGERYWALVRSGIQKEPLSQRDEMKKSLVTLKLQPSQGGGFGTPGAINAFLIALLYYVPGSLSIDDANKKVPAWLYPNFDQIFLQALAS